MPESGETILGEFRLLRELGRGGMGVVYLAEQIALRRRVALKVLPIDLTASPARLERFRREAEAAARLHHPNLIPIYAAGESGGQHWIAMEYVEGTSLDRILVALLSGKSPASAADSHVPLVVTDAPGETESRAPEAARPISLSPPPKPDAKAPAKPAADRSAAATREHIWWATHVAEKAARALHHAHERGVIHRDVKPGNILLDTEGEPRVGDFGLARDEGTISITRTGDVLGTPLYMSPEQLTAKRVPVDRRTDVYSLGATLYQALTLEPPYPGESSQEVIRQILFTEPAGLRRLNARIPRDLETIVLKALEKNPDRRYASASAFADDLRRFLDGEPIFARRASLPYRLWRRARAVRVPVPAAIALGLAAASLLALLLVADRFRPEARARAAHLHAVDSLRAGDAGAALGHAGRAVRLQPRNGAYFATLSEAREEASDVAGAVDAMERAVECDPTLRHWRRLAEILGRAGRDEDAIEPWKRVVKADPEDAEALNALGRCYEKAGDVESALAHYRRAGAARSEEVARVLASEEGDGESRARAALAIDPESVPALVALAGELAARTPAEAIEHLDRALSLDAKHPEAWALYAETLASQGRREEARRACDEAVAAVPDSVSLRALRAELLLEVLPRRPEAALQDVEFVLAQRPGDFDAALLRARACAALGRTLDARRGFEAAARLEPSRKIEAELGVALCDLWLGDSYRALAQFQACSILEPSDPRPLFLGAFARFLQGDFVEAEQEASKVIAVAPGHTRALALRASALLRLGRLRGALEDLERAYDLDVAASQAVLRWTLAEQADWNLLAEWAREPLETATPADPVDAARRFASRRAELDPQGRVGEDYLRGRGTGTDPQQAERLDGYVDALASGTGDMRTLAEKALREAGLEALPILESAAAGVEAERVRALAAELRSRADAAADHLLAEWLLEEEGLERVCGLGVAASRGLARVLENVGGDFSGPARLRRNLRLALVRTDPRGTRELAQRLVSEGKTVGVRRDAASLLVVVGLEESLPALLPALDDADALVRAYAAHALAAAAKADAIPHLLALAARESDPLVRQTVAFDLAALGDRDGMILLAYLLQRGPGELGAVSSLLLPAETRSGEEGRREAEIAEESARSGLPTFLLRMLDDPASLSRAGAVRLLAGEAGPRGEERLRGFLDHPDPLVRIPAAGALTRIGVEEGRRALEGALASAEPVERSLAAEEIVRIEDESGGAARRPSASPPTSVRAIAAAWVRRGDAVLPAQGVATEEERRGFLALALARYASAAAADASWWVPDARLGAAYHDAGDLGRAHASYARALAKGPGEEGALAAEAFHLLRCEKPDASPLPLFERLVGVRPSEALYLAGRGRARLASGDEEGAKTDLEDVLARPADARALAEAALGFLRLSDTEGARQALERAVQGGSSIEDLFGEEPESILEDPRFRDLLGRP